MLTIRNPLSTVIYVNVFFFHFLGCYGHKELDEAKVEPNLTIFGQSLLNVGSESFETDCVAQKEGRMVICARAVEGRDLRVLLCQRPSFCEHFEVR